MYARMLFEVTNVAVLFLAPIHMSITLKFMAHVELTELDPRWFRVHMESYSGLPIDKRPDVFAHNLGAALIHGVKALGLCTRPSNATPTVTLADGQVTPGSLLLDEVRTGFLRLHGMDTHISAWHLLQLRDG